MASNQTSQDTSFPLDPATMALLRSPQGQAMLAVLRVGGASVDGSAKVVHNKRRKIQNDTETVFLDPDNANEPEQCCLEKRELAALENKADGLKILKQQTISSRDAAKDAYVSTKKYVGDAKKKRDDHEKVSKFSFQRKKRHYEAKMEKAHAMVEEAAAYKEQCDEYFSNRERDRVILDFEYQKTKKVLFLAPLTQPVSSWNAATAASSTVKLIILVV